MQIVINTDNNTVVPMSKFMETVLESKLRLEEQVATLEQQLMAAQDRHEQARARGFALRELLGCYPEAPISEGFQRIKDLKKNVKTYEDLCAKLTQDKAHSDVALNSANAQIRHLMAGNTAIADQRDAAVAALKNENALTHSLKTKLSKIEKENDKLRKAVVENALQAVG